MTNWRCFTGDLKFGIFNPVFKSHFCNSKSAGWFLLTFTMLLLLKKILLSVSKSYHWVQVFRNLKTPLLEVRSLYSSIYRVYNEPHSCKFSRNMEWKVGEEDRGMENSAFPFFLCLICLVNSQPSVEAIISKTYSRRHVLENCYCNSWNPSSLEPILDSTYIYI